MIRDLIKLYYDEFKMECNFCKKHWRGMTGIIIAFIGWIEYMNDK